MKQLLSDLLERLLSGSELTRDDLLQGVLVSGLVFASIHLVTMLVTRWGDRRAEGKALMFSVLIHLTCFVGLVTFEPGPQLASEGQVEERTVVRRSVVVDDSQVDRSDPTTSAPWNALSRSEPTVPDRIERPQAETRPEPVPVPERTPREMPVETPTARVELPLETPVAVVAPKIEQVAEVVPRRIVPEVASPDESPVSESRNEIVATTPDRVAASRPRPTTEPDPVARQESPRSVELPRPEPSTSREPLTVAEAPVPRPEPRLGGAPAEVRPRTGPAPSNPLDENAGADPTPAPQSNPSSSTTVVRTSRSRPQPGLDDGEVVRTRPNTGPTTSPTSAPRPSTEIASVDSPGTQRPRLADPGELAPTRPRTSELPATYAERNVQRRAQVAAARGGTKSSEEAVELGLAWLARNQEPDGSWDADRHGSGLVKVDENGVDRDEAGKHADVGVTALSILAFLAAGYTHDEGKYATNVDRALTWLVQGQREDGYLGRGATHYEKMYCHAMATYSMAEAYAMQADRTVDVRLREPLRRAVDYILAMQNPDDGGWRYLKGQRSDMSMFGWQLMALKSAELAGLTVPPEARNRMIKFLRERSLGTRYGLAAYREGERVTSSMTAEALFCKQMLGIQRDNPACTEAVEFLLRSAPRRTEFNLYYWYYGTLAMFQYGGEPWRQWNELVRNILVADQITSGEQAGSWDPRKCPWGAYGGRVYSTALGTLCLEVYYRFLPLYQIAPDTPAPRPTAPQQP